MKVTSQSDGISQKSLMSAVVAKYPGAQRTLFRHYHIGGCQSCAFHQDESLAELCERNQIGDPQDVIAKIRESHDEDARFFIPPSELHKKIQSGEKIKILDIRTREEFDAVNIQGSVMMSQPEMQDILAYWDPDNPLIIVDHKGQQALDAAAYFSGHGMHNVRCLQGGIDSWANEVDLDMPRYTIE